MPSPVPPVLPKRVYQNHHLDSTRWDAVALRPGDVVISTAYKAGTTWMQTIVANLVYGGTEWGRTLHELSPWIDFRLDPIDDIVAQVESLERRRFLKTHLALDGFPFRDDVQHIVVGRDPRDVFMSFRNHYGSYKELTLQALNETPGRVGDPLPPCEPDIHRCWRDWLTRGWFDWERDGWPFWSFFHHLATWWEVRDRPNVAFFHYGDMLADLDGEMRRVAEFLSLPLDEARFPELVENCTFAFMKRDAEKYTSRGGLGFEGGAQTFIHKGTNERWRGVLDDEDLALYERVRVERLPPDCVRWLTEGRRAL